MALSQEDVVHILRLMDESGFEKLRLEMDGLKLIVSKHGRPAISGGDLPSQEPAVKASGPGDGGTRARPDNPASLPKVIDEKGGEGVRITEEAAEEGLIPIKAPMLGTFYRSPKPNDPPFVEVGQVVGEDTTVCVIEVMKLFSTIHAGSQGRIERICAEDGALVEYGQVLFWIRPGEASQEK